MTRIFNTFTRTLRFSLILVTGMTGCMKIRMVEDSVLSMNSDSSSYTVLTRNDDGCTNQLYRNQSWAPGLELLCHSSKANGFKSVALAPKMISLSDGSNAACWIALSDKVDEGRKVFCFRNGKILKLNTETKDIPEQVPTVSGSKVYFFGREANSKFVVYRWDWEKVEKLSGNYSGAAHLW